MSVNFGPIYWIAPTDLVRTSGSPIGRLAHVQTIRREQAVKKFEYDIQGFAITLWKREVSS